MLKQHASAWSQTVALLDNTRAQQAADEATRIARRRPAKTIWADHAALTVSVIELPTPRTATVSWCDPFQAITGIRHGASHWPSKVANAWSAASPSSGVISSIGRQLVSHRLAMRAQ